jgi:hypothetical protein
MEIRKVVLNPTDPMPQTRDNPQDYDIDGYIHIEKGGNLCSKVAFRRAERGGRSDDGEPSILLWENPGNPLDEITLSPTLNILGDDYVINNGEIQEI